MPDATAARDTYPDAGGPPAPGRDRRRRPRRRGAPRPRGWAGRALAAAALALFVLPLLSLVVRAFADVWRAPALVPQQLGTRGIAEVLGPTIATAFVNSLVVAVAATLLALVLGWPAARVLGERRLRHPGPVFLLLAMPLLVPQYATGVGLTSWFIRLGLTGTLVGLVLAHLTVVLPYVVLVLLSGFARRLTELEEMGRSLGASPPRRLVHVTLPAVRPTLLVAGFLGFVVSWSQYGTSLAVGGGTPMLPVVLLPFIGADPQIAATLTLLFLVPAVVMLVLVARAGRAPL